MRPAANSLSSFVRVSKNTSKTKITNTYGGVFQRVLSLEKFYNDNLLAKEPAIQFEEYPMVPDLQ